MILITGASGFLGRNLTEKLIALGLDIRLAVRHSRIEEYQVDQVAIGNISGLTDFSKALEGVQVVIHLAGLAHVLGDHKAIDVDQFEEVNTSGTRALARQASVAGVKRFIFISSIGVNGQNSAKPFTEFSQEKPQDIYSASKYEAEKALKSESGKHCMDYVIIRPPLIYGPSAPGNFSRLMKLVSTGLPLPFASIRNKRSLIYVKNLVDFITCCLCDDKASNQIFLVCDGNDLSLSELVCFLRNFRGLRRNLFSVPVFVFRIAGIVFNKSSVINKLIGNLQVDNSKVTSQMCWIPPYTVEQGIRDSVVHWDEGRE
ncbi:MAG: NAD-dependent epimerase/dehydratase family protein [Saccharospirillaceae bacterium]|nr:hypothetical protein A3759_00010 [Thalassolituus sp. HI0120]MCH2039330.1 NAD-dependent epimerase/dehydratase family protein [Saccharospirillaceae bacterium]